jgi:hypothetical protein
MPTGIGARIPRLGKFLSLKQTAADSNFEPWFDLSLSKSNSRSKNIIYRAPTKLQLSFNAQGLDQLGLQDIRLQSMVHELKHQL